MSELVKRLRAREPLFGNDTLYAEAADHIEALEAENARLQQRLASWTSRGRDLMLHDPELAEEMANFKRELREDPEQARALLRSIGALKDHP